MRLIVIIGVLLSGIILIASCQSDEELEFSRYYTSGSVIYQTRCMYCHGAKGEGLQLLIPPLTDSTYLKTYKQKLACIVKYGTKEKIKIAGKTFEGKMYPIALPSVQIAEVLTYVNNSFGNKLGVVTTEQVVNSLARCDNQQPY